ncbi:hypothetical protein GU926_03615 [Nibribacter ruber]|uniref:Uncharacterized protein n=1 Tax=Nibribacter ruber TaxID=2698458 RepID=A0A6P1NXJ5_9BACT|nr:hypothetical protein [Nibribacter ruber]QHL86575.1 hypothetical protein GU926_03615 [Nibribacter ruber]
MKESWLLDADSIHFPLSLNTLKALEELRLPPTLRMMKEILNKVRSSVFGLFSGKEYKNSGSPFCLH